ncbi:glycosyltransferase family 2 protein [Roseobacter litoralis]|uniref:Gylcosyl transferase-like protein n=1 Tax=Roseobacter litoralis (strain ATCC 49566 / DSM 6996 / JCM 21268 / NBRC 15278 / OCh 149) TaxID=391595 RepID=F7ZML5_ROSLO|nr:glycosyltransferase [Roseobacter litoralis]AEI96552.1 gylcosyl transferase-like protein [Roseobacter litoralis Och 149]
MSDPRPDLSIVIVEWNTIDMLRDCLASVFDKAGGLDIQVIVVDNASSDGSPEMVEAEFPQVTQIRNADNRGFAAANNQGFEICTGRYILLLNSDTYLLDDVMGASLRYLDNHSTVGAMGCLVLNPDRTMQRTCSMWPRLLDLMFMSSGLWKLKRPKVFGRYQMTHWQRNDERAVEVISGCYMMLRREVLEQVGQLDEDFFFFGEETDWCRRMRDAGWLLMFAPVGKIVHYGSASARKLNHKRDLMLTDATVRLHRKHSGRLAGSAAWVTLFGFNVSRATFWSLRSVVQHDRAALRAKHFRNVVIGMIRP